MDLILWRHAEAVDAPHGGDDMARKLTSRGEKQAARMAAWLDRQLPETACIWASTAQRTEQTALALGRKYKCHPSLAPDGTVDDLLALVQWFKSKGCVLVVGHQPLLGQTIAHLLGLHAGDCAVKKGAVWWLRRRDPVDTGSTVVVTVQTPEMV
jgi:phosphohistidine phosphatase